MMRWDVINALIKRYNFKSYLEIGYESGDSFDPVECEIKEAVDPNPSKECESCHVMTSDAYFENNTPEFDIVFIDGLHDYEQVKRDFDNSLKFAKVIVLHDMNPENEEQAKPFKDGGGWCGDCYKVAIDMYNGEYGLHYLTVDCNFGCGVVFNTEINMDKQGNIITRDYESFAANRNQILNLISETEFINLLQDGDF